MRISEFVTNRIGVVLSNHMVKNPVFCVLLLLDTRKLVLRIELISIEELSTRVLELLDLQKVSS